MTQCEFRQGQLNYCGTACNYDLFYVPFYAQPEAMVWIYLCTEHILHYWPDGDVPEDCIDPSEDNDDEEECDEDEDEFEDDDKDPYVD